MEIQFRKWFYSLKMISKIKRGKINGGDKKQNKLSGHDQSISAHIVHGIQLNNNQHLIE